MRFGINLWGVYDVFAQDHDRFFALLKESGFRYLEPCMVIGEEIERLPQFMGRKRILSLLEETKNAGISVTSVHLLIRDEQQAVPTMRELAEEYGVKQFVLKCPKDISKDTYTAYGDKLCAYAEALRPYQTVIALHNETQDTLGTLDGISAYAWLLKYGRGLVKAEPDTGWLLKGNCDPETFLWENRDVITSVHYKDIDSEGTETVLGKGRLDADVVFQFARYSECIQYIDVDLTGTDMKEVIRASGRYLRRLQNTRTHTDSVLCVYDMETDTITELKQYEGIIEAPNWMPGQEVLVYNSRGKLWKYDMRTEKDTMIDTGSYADLNNDHVLSSDGKYAAFSCYKDDVSLVFTCDLENGNVKQITPVGDSWLHGWSYDMKELTYCGFRNNENGERRVDIYTIPADGGDEKQLTVNAGFNDGPEFAPDNEHIWFISTRSGLMQVYRMNRDGSEQTQMTFEEQNNWFGHVSPDNRYVVNISYHKDALEPTQHLANMQVSLWLMRTDGSERKHLFDLCGGQGSINVNSWAADSKRFAFVKYILHHR